MMGIFRINENRRQYVIAELQLRNCLESHT